jgi:hypothetical protein
MKKGKSSINFKLMIISVFLVTILTISFYGYHYVSELALVQNNTHSVILTGATGEGYKAQVWLRTITLEPRDVPADRLRITSNKEKSLTISKNGRLYVNMQFKNVGDKPVWFSFGLIAQSWDVSEPRIKIYEPHLKDPMTGQGISGENSIDFRKVDVNEESVFTHEIVFGKNGATVKMWLKCQYREEVEGQTGFLDRDLQFKLKSNVLTIIEPMEIDVYTQ